MKKENLKKVRLAKGITQEQMAAVICRDKSAYCRKERGKAKILMTEWQKMAIFLQVELEEIYQNDLEEVASAASGKYYYIPIAFVVHLQDYIRMLKNKSMRLNNELAATREELAAAREELAAKK